MARTSLVSSNSPILRHSSTRILHTYSNGDVLVTTAAPALESGDGAETAVQQGVVFPNQQTSDRRHEGVRSTSAAIAPSGFTSPDPVTAYIALIGPVDPVWVTTLNGLGLELLQYHPVNSYLSRGPGSAFQQALAQPFVLDVVPLDEAVKPITPVPESGDTTVCIVVQGDRTDAPALMETLSALPGVTIDPTQTIDAAGVFLRILAQVDAAGQDALRQQPSVLAVEAHVAPQLEDEVAGLIIAGEYDASGRPQGSYLQWLEDQGLTGAAVTIGIVDAGVDGSHPAFGDRVKDVTQGRKSWHGTFVAGHAAGCYLTEQDSGQFIYGLGIAPKAQLLAQNNYHSATALCRETVTQTVAGVAGTIQNNSWGAGTANPMTYGSMEATYDALVRNADADSPHPKPLTICFSSGNSGPAGLTRPKAAKNLIVTGNSETYRPEVGKDQSDSIDEVYAGPRGSSHGNCADGRIVPHLVAPGEWTASANYDSRPGEREYISANLTWGGGSSAASPKTAGACALLTQWWRRHNDGAHPSPALLKALLVNGAEPMSAGGPIPNPIQGWGRLNLGNVLSDAVRHFYLDQSVLLTARGEQKTWTLRVSDPRKPVKVTLCWTDPPGAIGSGSAQASAIVNQLALRVDGNGQRYRANQFQNGWSYPGGTAQGEGQDNLQNIYLPGGTGVDRLQVSVTALNLTTNCLTGRISSPQQDFALVVTNGSLDESDTPANLFIAVDPVPQEVEPAAPDHFWQGDDQDREDLDQAWWQTITPANPDPSTSDSPPATSDQSDANSRIDRWWLQQDVWWTAETQRENDREAKALEQGLQTAAIALTSSQHQLFTASPVRTESSGTESSGTSDLVHIAPHGDPNHPTPGLQNLPLSQALSQLMAQWHRFGGKQTHRPVAVLVVRRATRLSPADLSALRRLAFWGQLYLVSDYAPILAFLAQRIHQASGIQMRLASDASALPALMQETLLDASGAQQAAVHQIEEPLLDGVAIHHLVQIVPSDRQMTIQLQFPPGAPPELQLIPPDQVPLVGPDSSPGPVTIIARPGLLQLDVEPTQVSSWAGQWTLRLKQDGAQTLSRVRVWVRSALQWQVQAQDAPIYQDAPRYEETGRDARGRDGHNVLVTVTGSSTQLSRLQAQPRPISAATGDAARPTPETDRWLTTEAELPRQDQGARAEESQRESPEPVYAPTLSTILSPPRDQGALAIDFPTRVEGMDAFGYRYDRLLRRSLLFLEPRSRWRQRLDRPRSVLFTPAQIAEVHMEAGALTGLTLKRGPHTRRVAVTDPTLKQALTQAFKHRFPQQDLVAGVVGDELQGLFCPLQRTKSRQLARSLSNEED